MNTKLLNFFLFIGALMCAIGGVYTGQYALAIIGIFLALLKFD